MFPRITFSNRNHQDMQSPAWKCGDLTVIAKRILAVFVRVVIHRMKKNKYNGEVSLCD